MVGFSTIAIQAKLEQEGFTNIKVQARFRISTITIQAKLEQVGLCTGTIYLSVY